MRKIDHIIINARAIIWNQLIRLDNELLRMNKQFQTNPFQKKSGFIQKKYEIDDNNNSDHNHKNGRKATDRIIQRHKPKSSKYLQWISLHILETYTLNRCFDCSFEK